MLTLVTGVPGWLGRRLVEVLIHGVPDVQSLAEPKPTRRVRCLVLPGSNAMSNLGKLFDRIEIVEGDLRDPQAVKEFCRGAADATLFHCAGVIHPIRGVKEFFDVNVDGTKRLLSAAEAAGVRRAIVVSSNSPLGMNRSRNEMFDETSPYRPYMGYGRSKMLMEQIVQSVQERRRMETVVVRAPWFYGPWQPSRQTLFFSMVKRGKVPIVGDGNNKRSMVYIDNLCHGLLLCEDAPTASGQTYWIADRRPYTMNEIVETIERLLETEFGVPVAHKRLRLPNVVSELALLLDWSLQRLGLYHQKIHVLSEMNKTIACSIAKAEKEVGYKPTIDLEEGMRRSISWCLSQEIEI